jgi:hypothetical protein
MSDNVITFPEPAGLFSKRRTIPVASKSHENVRNGPNMHTLLFRSYDLIVQSDEAELVRDVCFDIDKAQTKLKAVQLLTAADTKLTAAIVAALLSTRGGNASA